MAVRGLEHFKQERDALQLILQMSGQNRSPEGQLSTTLIEAMLETAQKIIAAAEEGKPFIATSLSTSRNRLLCSSCLSGLPCAPLSPEASFAPQPHPGISR